MDFFGITRSGKSAQLAHQGGGVSRRGEYILHQWNRILLGETIALDVTEQYFGRTHNEHERVVKIMRDAAGHRAHRGKPLSLSQLLFAGSKLYQSLLHVERTLAHSFLKHLLLVVKPDMSQTHLDHIGDSKHHLTGVNRLTD